MDTCKNEHGMQYTLKGPNLFQPCGPTTTELPAGAFSASVDNSGPFYRKRELSIDSLIDVPHSLPNQILEEIERFWGQGAVFERFGFLHRRGYLLYGKQGCGKSSLVHQIVANIVQAGHVAFFCDSGWVNGFIRAVEQFRETESERPVVCIFEDIEAIIEDQGDSALLQWLDGNHQVDRAINLATTNYPEKLDRRIIARPRRFDRILKIEAPDPMMREAFFTRKLAHLPRSERESWVEASDGLTFAALAELVISVCCLGYELEDAAARLRKLDAHTPTSGEFQNGTAQEEPALN